MQIPSTSPFFPTTDTRKAAQPAAFFATPEAAETSQAKTEFREYMSRTPAEQIRAEILDSMGLKEEDLKGLDPKMRELIERKIEERIQQKVELDAAQKGTLIDIKA